MNTKKLLASVAAAVIALCAVPISAGAETVLPSGLTSEKLENKIRQEYNMIFDQTGSNPDSNSLSYTPFALSCFSGGEVLYTGYYGKINMQEDILADENTVFEWGSVSKTMIWVSIMQLWEQGQLSLDEDVRTYLPDGFFHNLRYDDPITLTDIMNHKGGWCESTYAISTPDPENVPSLEQALHDSEPPQTYRPGTTSAYSNWGAALAGFIVERVSGMSYSDYVRKNIFDVIGMEHTAIFPNHSDNPWVQEQRSHNHTMKLSGISYVDLGSCNYYITLYPAGSATGTISDLTKYTQALADMDSPIFKNRATHEKLFSGSDFYGSEPFFSYGFMITKYSETVCYGHNGATEAGIAYIMFDPVSETGVVGACSELGSNYIYDMLPEWVFGSYSKEVPEGGGEPFTLSGYYNSTRTQMSGLNEYLSLLSTTSGKQFGELHPLSDDLAYHVDSETGIVDLIGTPTAENGKKCIAVGAGQYIPAKNYIPRLCLFTIYILLAIASIFTLIVDVKLKRSGKLAPYSGSAVLTAGKLAKILSLLTLLGVTSAGYIPGYMGIPSKSIGMTAGCLQMVCMGIFAVAAVLSAVLLIKNKSSKLRYITGIAGNAMMLIAVASFHMYQFWGC